MLWRYGGDIVVWVLPSDDVVGAATLEVYALEGQSDSALIGIEARS